MNGTVYVTREVALAVSAHERHEKNVLLNGEQLAQRVQQCRDVQFDVDNMTLFGNDTWLKKFDKMCTRDDDVLSRLKKLKPEIHDVLLLSPDHLLVAGGSVTSAITGAGRNQTAIDLDVFIHGLDVQQATDLAKQIVAMLIFAWPDAELTLSGHAITVRQKDFQAKKSPVQIITRCFRDEAQILHSFDLAPSRCGFSLTKGLLMTEAAAFAFATSIGVVDLTRLNTLASFGRIHKYSHEKDFLFVIPEMVRVVASTRIPPDLGDGYRTTPCMTFMNQYNSKRVLAMYAQPGYGGAMDADEYGFQSNYQGVHFIFNLRHARDGKRKNIVFQAPAENTLDSVLQNPIVPGLDYLDDWFDESNLAAPEFANWPEINPYTAWDIEYRFGHAYYAELEDAQKEHDAKKCRELIERMKARIREQLLLAVEERKQAPLFQDVRDLDLVPPFSAWLCKHPREILSDLYSSKCDSSGHLPWEISVLIWQLWKRNPDWMKLPRDVFRLLRQHISRVSWKFVIDDFYRGKRK